MKTRYLLSPLALLQIALLALKLTGSVIWSWLWILSPIWIPIAIALAVPIAILVFFVIIAAAFLVAAAVPTKICIQNPAPEV
jgi:hypothetical protein